MSRAFDRDLQVGKKGTFGQPGLCSYGIIRRLLRLQHRFNLFVSLWSI